MSRHDAPMLHGYTIGITADRRSEEQAGLFERRGASVVHGASIRSLPLGDDQRLRDATDAVIERRPVALVANTGVGIRSWFSAAETWGVAEELTAALADAHVYARGPKAASAVQLQGIDIEACAATERLREAVDLVLATVEPGEIVALQLAGGGASEETERLEAAGAQVIEIPVYEWTLPDDTGPALRLARGIIAGSVHAVTFTTGPAIRNLMTIASDHDLESELRSALTDGRTVVGCVGPVCAEAAADEGLDSPHLVVPGTWRLGPLVRAIADRLAERAIAVELAGTTMTITGNLVAYDGASVVLTDTEAQVLAVLASQPNVVHAKSDLLRRVWRDDAADPHVVESVVTRLRRQLGPAGSSIGAVHRRGYTLRT